jgi:hypothetical protein
MTISRQVAGDELWPARNIVALHKHFVPKQSLAAHLA